MASMSQALGEGTGIPAAMGAILMNRGKVYGKGVMPPEGCLHPNELPGPPARGDDPRRKEGGR